MECPRCGTENRPEVRFCRHCGQRLVFDQPPDLQSQQTVIPSPIPSAVCDACGAPVKPNARFCPRCGKALQPSTPSPILDTTAGQTDQMTPTATASATAAPQAIPQKPSYSQPMEPPPSIKHNTLQQESIAPDNKQKRRDTRKPIPRWIVGAIVTIVLLLIALIVLIVVFMPKVLQGTGLLAADTPTGVVIEHQTPTSTPTISPSPTIEPTHTLAPTPAPTIAPFEPSASVVLTTAPETITVSSKVVVTVSLTNDSTELIYPLRCDLVGNFIPALRPSEGITYSIVFPDSEPPLESGAIYSFVYYLDALESGTTNLGAHILIEVGHPDHRQVVQSPMVPLIVR
jgi:hypothetical protein